MRTRHEQAEAQNGLAVGRHFTAAGRRTEGVGDLSPVGNGLERDAFKPRFRAERKYGELLKIMEKAKRGPNDSG